jgi:hypothetical protein
LPRILTVVIDLLIDGPSKREDPWLSMECTGDPTTGRLPDADRSIVPAPGLNIEVQALLFTYEHMG